MKGASYGSLLGANAAWTTADAHYSPGRENSHPEKCATRLRSLFPLRLPLELGHRRRRAQLTGGEGQRGRRDERSGERLLLGRRGERARLLRGERLGERGQAAGVGLGHGVLGDRGGVLQRR